ncbi:MAG: HAD-IIB family hydrolase [Pseudomonadota bacterium]
MTATTALPPLSARHFTLATDLDGTFLGGTEADRQTLYEWIEARRESVGLIFVTGRDPHFITGMVRAGVVPKPDYVVGDVGTTIAEVDENAEIHPIKPLEEEIAARWDNRGDEVRAALSGHPGLTLQPTGFRYRVSYDMDPEEYSHDSAKTMAGLGLDTLVSDNRYFDVLPPGVSKGPSLVRLLAYLQIARTSVLAAGDTMNDKSMLTCGLPAVAVGGSEPDLLSHVASLDYVHKAEAIGAAGILEAIDRLSLHPEIGEASHVV